MSSQVWVVAYTYDDFADVGFSITDGFYAAKELALATVPATHLPRVHDFNVMDYNAYPEGFRPSIDCYYVFPVIVHG